MTGDGGGGDRAASAFVKEDERLAGCCNWWTTGPCRSRLGPTPYSQEYIKMSSAGIGTLDFTYWYGGETMRLKWGWCKVQKMRQSKRLGKDTRGHAWGDYWPFPR